MRSYVRVPVRDHSAVGAAGELFDALCAALSRGLAAVMRWQELARQRRALAALDDHMLKDLGLSRADAAQESGRRFWDEGGDPWRISR
jgi:uncharacterized protein YjiS (DUF1127 family)